MQTDNPAGHVGVLRSRLRRSQQLHVLGLLLIPLLGTLGAAAWAVYRPPTALDLLLLVAMWAISGGLGISVGYHRLFTHRSFDAPAWVRCLIGAAGSMAFQGPLIYWVAVHRRHHECSDADGDPHSPRAASEGIAANLRGLWHGHAGWMWSHQVASPTRYAPDLLKDTAARWVNRTYTYWAVAGLALPAAVAGLIGGSLEAMSAGLVYGGVVRVFVTTHLICSVNSLCHWVGTQQHDTRDDSRNLAVLAVPTFGEAWHNGHHAYPYSAKFGQGWWQLDLGYLVIRCLAVVGLATNIRTKSQ